MQGDRKETLAEPGVAIDGLVCNKIICKENILLVVILTFSFPIMGLRLRSRSLLSIIFGLKGLLV